MAKVSAQGWRNEAVCVVTLGKAFVSRESASFIPTAFAQFQKEFMYTTYPVRVLLHPFRLNSSWENYCSNNPRGFRRQGYSTPAGLDHPYDSPIIPFIVGDNASVMELGKRFNEAGIRVGVIRPPSVAEGTARLRISINRNLSVGAFESKFLPIIHQFKAENSSVDGLNESKAAHV